VSEVAARIAAAPSIPDDEDLCAWFRGGPVKAREIRALHRLLGALAADAPLPACADAVVAAAEWIDRSAARFALLLEVLERVPPWRHAVAHAVATVVHDTDPVSLFELGLPNDRGLREETSDRLAHKLLPSPRDDKSLADLVGRMLPRRGDAAWLAALPAELAARFAALVRESPTGDPWARARHGILETVALVATRTSALGLSREIRARSPEVTLAASPFFLLPRLCDALFSGVDTSRAIREQIAACREVLEAVLRHLEEFGVSVDVVYRIEVIGKNLDRTD
jgi:site-specific recombinase